MIRISGIKLNREVDFNELKGEITRKLKINETQILSYEIDKLSIDARNKPELSWVYTLNVETSDDRKILSRLRDKNISFLKKEYYSYPKCNNTLSQLRPVVVGCGPAGLFCAYALAEQGFKPVLLERGQDVDSRTADVENFFHTGILKPDSNVQFGEGGAGAFSDGKLNTQVKDKYLRKQKVTDIFLRNGAPSEIAYLYHPHIGTDALVGVIKNIRNEIIRMGGTVRFEARVTDLVIENDRISGVIVNEMQRIDCDTVVLAIGHSARDTFMMLHSRNVPMQPKPMACGVRIEHPKEMIDMAQYGRKDITSDYKLTCNLPNGRGVYSFCMCPGGYVINSSSEEGRLCVNGMSYYDRNGLNSNSALVVTVSPEDYGIHPDYPEELAGLAYQRDLEERAYRAGEGRVPVQTYGNFCKSLVDTELQSIHPQIKGEYKSANLRDVLPDYITESIISAMPEFGRKIKGFDREDAVLSAVESRTSSPVRIIRGEDNQSVIRGLYPCGEGAGYAGGIMSAAMDGIRVAESIMMN